MDDTEKYLIGFLLLLFGAAIGAFVSWLMSAKKREQLSSLEVDNRLFQERLKQSQAQSTLDKDNLNKLSTDRETLTNSLFQQRSINATLEERLQRDKEESGKNQEQLRKDFELLSNKILEEKTQKFTEQNKLNLESLLSPFKEKIDVFQKKVEDTHLKSTEDRMALLERIKTLSVAHEQLSSDAKNLTVALKGDNKAQGNWGELILEKVLESSNLRKGEEYFAQYAMTNDEGKRIQPDFVVKLPDGKHIIIDSKVSLVAYERYVSEQDDTERANHLKSHLISIKNHIRQLSEKNYHASKDVVSPDFVLMFMPVEPSFALAVREDTELFSFAWDRKIVIVSPSTLLATLRTISSLWKQERQNRNTEEIARHAASLYDKFYGFVEDMKKVEVNLGRAMGSYNESMKKLSTGKGNLLRQVERLRELGVKGKQTLDHDSIQNSIDRSAVSTPSEKQKDS